MHFKKKIQNCVYHLYLNSTSIWEINAFFPKLSEKDIEEIIDYMNEIYN